MEEKRIEILERICSAIKDDDDLVDIMHVLVALLGSSMSRINEEKFEVYTKNEKLTFLIENLNKNGVKLC